MQNTDVSVNILYAFELGFGSYDIGGLDVDVYKLPLSYTFRLTSDGKYKQKSYPPYPTASSVSAQGFPTTRK